MDRTGAWFRRNGRRVVMRRASSASCFPCEASSRWAVDDQRPDSSLPLTPASSEGAGIRSSIASAEAVHDFPQHAHSSTLFQPYSPVRDSVSRPLALLASFWLRRSPSRHAMTGRADSRVCLRAHRRPSIATESTGAASGPTTSTEAKKKPRWPSRPRRHFVNNVVLEQPRSTARPRQLGATTTGEVPRAG